MTQRPLLRTMAVALTLAACTRGRAVLQRADGGVDSLAAPYADAGARVTELLAAENRRDASGITEEDLGSRDVERRRLATRALSRIGSPATIPALLKVLADEDPEVEAWAAYGLGYMCRLNGVASNDIARALVARSLHAGAASGRLDPEFAIARALGRCATDEAEQTLVAWLEGPRGRAADAALALGDVASRRKTLGEPTALALLAAAAGGAASPPLPEALYAFGRLDHLPAVVDERMLEVARARLGDAGPARLFLVRALSRVGKGSADLERVLQSPTDFDPQERAEAARGLARLGDAGQRALADALSVLAPGHDPVSLTTLATPLFGPLSATLDAMKGPLPGEFSRAARARLFDMAELPLPPGAPAAVTRRVTQLRCRAASLLVNGASLDPMLVACDPDPGGEIGARAQIDVLGRRPIREARLVQWKGFATSPHPKVREGALELLAGHGEIEGAPVAIARALEDPVAGVVATAAELIGAHPDRAGKGDEVATGVTAALERTFPADAIETVGALVEAAGALRLAGAAPQLERLCHDPNPTLREHAARALSWLRGSKMVCSASSSAAAASELSHLAIAPVKLELSTDAGSLVLTLDPALAPVAVTRVADLARAGFYRGLAVHRVVPGFVAQFGDPDGDGFGGPSKEPLRCETTPAPFQTLDVGVALAGRDTGASQLFVTLGRYPHLDGEYALVGHASGDWESVSEGDVIRDVRVFP